MGVLPVHDTAASPMSSYFKSKLGLPISVADCIDRPRVIERVINGLRAPVSCLIAPAGFGKTTALALACRALAAEGIRVAWLTLDVHDREPARLAQGLMQALTEAGLSLAPLRIDADMSLSTRKSEPFAAALAARLQATGERIVVVLDDLEHLAGAQSASLLRSLLAVQPACLHLAFAGRSHAAIDTAALSLQGVLREVGQAELRFTPAETRDFLGDGWSPAAVTQLMSQSDGWAAVLRLARLRGEPLDSGAEISTAGGSARADVFRYFAHEVIGTLAPETRQFLFRTAVTPRVNADLAGALSGRADAGALLAGLERDNLLVQRVEGKPGWFRYHALLAQYLMEEMAAHEPSLVAQLHATAARWLGAHGEPVLALDHARQAGDDDFAFTLAEGLGGWRLSLRHALAALRMLPTPLADPRRWPRVFLGQAYLLAQQGQVEEARELLDAAVIRTGGFGNGENPDDARHLAAEAQMVGCILRIYEDLPIAHEHVASLEHLLADADRVEPEVRAIVPNFLTFALFDSGDLHGCIAEGCKAMRRNRFRQAAYAENYLHTYVGLAHLHLGDLAAARAEFIAMENQALQQVGAPGNQTAIAQVLLAAVDYAEGDLAAAAGRIQPCLSVVEDGDGWFELFQLGYEVEVGCALAARDTERAAGIAARAMRLAAARGQHRLQSWAGLVQQWVQALVRGHGDGLAGLRGQDLPPATLGDGSFRWARIQALGSRLRILGLLANGMPQRARHELREHKRQAAAGAWPCLRLGIGILEAALAAATGESARAERLFGMAQSEAGRTGQTQAFIDGTRGIALRQEACLTDVPVPATPSSDLPASLTPRETEILMRLNDGLSSKEIASRLGVAEGTVKVHRKNMYRKLDVTRRSEAIARGRTLGLIA